VNEPRRFPPSDGALVFLGRSDSIERQITNAGPLVVDVHTSKDIRDHRQKSARVHLFVRQTKKTGQKATPFTYCGEVDFVSWEGNKPVTVRWRLRERIPASLHANLKVPA